MTATDELRKLLEKHDIKHFDYDKGGRTQTQWAAPDGTRHFTYETYNNPSKTAKLVISWFPTPEQAIAATLGSGTCKLEETESYSSERGIVHVLECSNCGQECEHVNGDYEHCPHCLARNALF